MPYASRAQQGTSTPPWPLDPPAARDIPSAPDAPTLAGLRARADEVLGRILLDDLAGRDPTPHPDSVALLRGYVRMWGSRWEDGTQIELMRHGRRALLVGEDDPLVRYAVAHVAAHGGDWDSADALMDDALAEVEERSAPFVRALVLQAHQGLRQVSQARPDEVAAIQERRLDALVEAVRDPHLVGADEWIYTERVTETWGEGPYPPRLVAALRDAADVRPYAAGLLLGYHHFEKAFAARGTGAAAGVTEPGWRGFHDNLVEARAHLVGAWEAEPGLPHAPAQLVRVDACLGAPHAVQRMWFDRALAACMDFRGAYGGILHFSMPRWGGSHRLILEIGEEALETERYDTSVPTEFATGLLRLLRDVPAPDLFANPRIQDRLRTYYEGTMASPAPRGQRGWVATFTAAALALGGAREEAARMFEQFDCPDDARALEVLGLDDQRLVALLGDALEPERIGRRPDVPHRVPVVEGWAEVVPTLGELPADDVRTWRGLQREMTDWIGRIGREAYLEVGRHRDPSWDDDAQTVVQDHASVRVELADARTVTAYRRAERRLLASDCDDPLVLCCLARGADPLRGAEAPLALLERAEVLFARDVESGREWPAVFRFLNRRDLAAARAAAAGSEQKASRAPLDELALEMARSDIFRGPAAAYFVPLVLQPTDYGYRHGILQRPTIERIVRDESVDEWVRVTLEGIALTADVTTGPCSPGVRSSLDRFGTLRGRAERRLARSVELRPDLPFAYATWIALANMDPDHTRRTRELFLQAHRTGAGLPATYQNYLWSLRPDQGGSRAELYAATRQLAECGLYGVGVPQTAWFGLEYLAASVEHYRQAWVAPEVADLALALCEGMLESDAMEERGETLMRGERRFAAEGIGMLAWARGDLETALDELDLSRSLVVQWLTKLGGGTGGVEPTEVAETLRRELEIFERGR